MNNLKVLKKNLTLNTYTKFSFGQNNGFYKQSLRYFSFNLNPFNKKNNNANGMTSRLTELQKKLTQRKIIKKQNEDKEEGESVNETRDVYAQRTYDRFLKFLENKDTFTWQNNLELIKMANTNNTNVIWSRYLYLEPQYLQQSVEELNRFVSCISEEEDDKHNFNRRELKNISIITGIPVLKCHYLIYNFRYYSTIHQDYKKKLFFNKPFYKNPKELIYAISNDSIPEFKSIREDYTKYIRARLGYTERFIEKQSMNYSKKNYEDVLKTNKF